MPDPVCNDYRWGGIAATRVYRAQNQGKYSRHAAGPKVADWQLTDLYIDGLGLGIARGILNGQGIGGRFFLGETSTQRL